MLFENCAANELYMIQTPVNAAVLNLLTYAPVNSIKNELWHVLALAMSSQLIEDAPVHYRKTLMTTVTKVITFLDELEAPQK